MELRSHKGCVFDWQPLIHKYPRMSQGRTTMWTSVGGPISGGKSDTPKRHRLYMTLRWYAVWAYDINVTP